MNASYRLALWQALAIVCMVSILMFAPSAQAQDNDNLSPHCCPAPVVREKPKVEACCPAPVIRQKPLPPAETCCPVDPKEVKKAQKEADHAAHEAAEACKRQQKEAEHQQAKVDAATAHAQHEIDEAQAKVEKRNGEYSDAQAKLNSFPSTESAACCAPAPEVMRSKPEPEPLAPPIAEAPAPQAPVIIEPIIPAPTVQEEKPEPQQLPKTASPMELIGLIGLISLSARYSKRFLRR